MFNSELLIQYENDGCFDNYSTINLLNRYNNSPAIIFQEEYSCLNEIQFEKDLFLQRFEKAIEQLTKIIGYDMTKSILISNFSVVDEIDFLFRFRNILFFIELFKNNTSHLSVSIENPTDYNQLFTISINGKDIFCFSFIKYEITNYINGLKNNKNIVLSNLLLPNEIEVKLEKELERENCIYLNSYNEQIIQLITPSRNAFNKNESQNNIIVFQTFSKTEDTIDISKFCSFLGNNKTGLLKSDLLYQEYKIDTKLFKHIREILFIKVPSNFYFYEQDVSKLDEKYNYSRIINKLLGSCNILDNIQETEYNDTPTLVNCDVSEIEHIQNIYNPYIRTFLNSIGYLTEGQLYKIKEGIIATQFNKFKTLVNNFMLDKEDAKIQILKNYEYIYYILKTKYPIDHPFHKCFPFGNYIFSLAYCKYILEKKFNDTKIIEDYLQRKLISAQNNKTDFKMYNENLGEFSVFLYLFYGLFCVNNEVCNYTKIEYEPDGDNNKVFEYSFHRADGIKLLFEVKTLTCEPEIKDSNVVNFHDLNNGQLFYKKYFKPDTSDCIPDEIKQNGIELSSNYRQIAHNIRRIIEKCENDNNIKIGFIVINYGTSREEFLSYLYNSQYGYLNTYPLEKVDSIVLWSMYTITTLFMPELLENEQIFVFPKNISEIDTDLYNKLRLNNFVEKKATYKYYKTIEDRYGVYELIKNENIVTILPKIDSRIVQAISTKLANTEEERYKHTLDFFNFD